MPAVPMPRPSSSSEARYPIAFLGSTSNAAPSFTVGVVRSSASAPTTAELQASGTASKLQQISRKSGGVERIGPDCMARTASEQITPNPVKLPLLIGVDVGGTFTD